MSCEFKTEDIAQFLFEQRELLKLADSRAFYFERARSRAVNARKKQNELNNDAYDARKRMDYFLNALRDDKKMKLFMFHLQQIIGATQRLRHYLDHRIKTQKSLTQIRLEQTIALTPLELLQALTAKWIPIVRKEQVAELLAKYQKELSNVHLVTAKYAGYRHQVERLFVQTFIHRHDAGVL